MKTKHRFLVWLLLLAPIPIACKETRYVYYDNDQKKLQMVYEFDEETGTMDGSYKEYRENGKLEIDGFYEHGKKNGVFKAYDYDGNLMSETSYKKDERDGIYKEFYTNGNLKLEASYKSGKLDGIYKKFYDDGTLGLEATYKHDELDGAYKFFDKDGTLRTDAFYKNNDLDGVYKEFDKNGILRIEILLNANHFDGSFKLYDNNGNLVVDGDSLNGKYEHTHFFTDPRDNQSYPISIIGEQVWMAANLNYETYSSLCSSDEGNCTKHGQFYTWEEARRICPDGWHLPSKEEFETLFTSVGEHRFVGTMLKTNYGWTDEGNGADAFGFSAFPAGLKDDKGKYDLEYASALFWSSTGVDGYIVNNGIHWEKNAQAQVLELDFHNHKALFVTLGKYYGLPVRCIRD